MISKTELVLFVGATGKTGIRIANFLLGRRVRVRLLVRSRERVTQLFGDKETAF